MEKTKGMKIIGNTLFITIMSVLITSAMLFAGSCENGNGPTSGNGNEPTKSSKAEISALTVSVNSNDYDISFEADNTAVLIIPAAETVPGKVQVTAVSLSDGATGLAMDEELSITDGKAAMTITAEDGSTQGEYTLAIAQIAAEEMPKALMMDRRYHYAAFTVQSKSGANPGRFKFGLKAVTEEAPTASELADGAGIYRKVTGIASRNILAYTLDSGIGAYVSSSEVQNKVVLHGNNGADVDQYLLVPDEEYALYTVKDGSGMVFKLATFSTDTFDANSSPFEDGKISDGDLLKGQYVYDPQDAVFLMPYFLAIDELNISVHTLNEKQLTSFSPGSLRLDDNTTEISVLLPSQMTDGTNSHRTIGGKKIAGFFVCVSQANLSTYSYNVMKYSVVYNVASSLHAIELVFNLTQDWGALITGLSVTINSNDYPVTFSGYNAAAISIPQSETIPATLTVKELSLLDGVTGVQVNDTVNISNGKAEITVSKDGASITYTITVANS